MAPGTGTANTIIVFTALSVSSVSILASIFALAIFFIHIQRKGTVLRNSLNFMWSFVVFVSFLGALQTVVGRALWYAEGDSYAASKNFCTFGAATNAGERVLLAGSLLMYYINMYVVRKYDEPRAMKCVKWYFLAILIATSAVIIFAVVTAPDSYERHGNRCVLIVDSVQGNVPLVLPLVTELAIVVVGLISAFGLLCSQSKVNSSSSRRRVWVHVFFMTFLFLSRLAMTIAIALESADTDNGSNDQSELGNATLVEAILLLINTSFTWALGLITSLIFAYTECLYVVVQAWCQVGCGDSYSDEEYDPLIGNVTGPSFISDRDSSCEEPTKRGADDEDEGTVTVNETASAVSGQSGSLAAHHHHSRNAALHSGRLTSQISLEEHLQGYTLSYTVRSSSHFADGEIPH
eukprot:GILI01022756.1.p1 GENE.GILI01022756.1~~GILI01022756.1.p1  ORF type:complete len:436 (+),score=21.70 GILI01022756.1:90-1310(+)